MKINGTKNPLLKNNRKDRPVMIALSAFLITLLLPISVNAAQSDYRNCSEINLNEISSAYNILELPDEVIGQSKADMGDLRIYDGAKEIPYAVISDYETMTPVYEEVEMLNRGTDSKGNLVFELQIPEERWIRQINFKSANQNFIRTVKVEGSMDHQEWRLLTSASTIFDLSDEQKSRHLEINLPPTNLSYLRVTISKGEKGEFQPQGVELLSINEPNAPINLKERPFKTISHERKDGIEEYTIDLLRRQLPVSELEFVTDAENFNRIVTLYESKDAKKWDDVVESEIYSYKLDKLVASQLMIKFRTNQRYLKVEIQNEDNQSLSIKEIKVRGINPSLIFPADRATEYNLYWNNSQAETPVYDIEKFKNNLDYSNIPKASIGKLEENVNFVFKDTRPWTERNSWLLKLAITGAAAFLLLIIARSFLKISKDS
jgi:hypothetical protein